jgi:hypothetical protein
MAQRANAGGVLGMAPDMTPFSHDLGPERRFAAMPRYVICQG